MPLAPDVSNNQPQPPGDIDPAMVLGMLELVTARRFAEAGQCLRDGSPAPNTLARGLLDTRLAGLFHAASLESSILECFDSADRTALSEAYERQVRLNQVYLALLCEMRDRLAAESAPLLLLKGLFLAVRFGGGSDRRFMWDADILVHRQHVPMAVRAGQALGLSATGSRLPIALLDRLNLHAIEVSHRGRAIDIHWHLRNRPGYSIDYRRIWSDAQTVVIDGEPFQAPSDADALLLALLEIAGDMERSHIKPRTLWDVRLMLAALDRRLDWTLFFSQRRDEGLLPIAVNMLTFCLAIFDRPGDFSALTAVLNEQVAPRLITDRESALRILARARQHLANRALYSRLQPRPTLYYWGWWLASAPFRFALTGNL